MYEFLHAHFTKANALSICERFAWWGTQPNGVLFRFALRSDPIYEKKAIIQPCSAVWPRETTADFELRGKL